MEKIFNFDLRENFNHYEVDIKGSKKYYVEGYASTVDRDLAGEVISESAQRDIYNQMLNQNITLDVEHEEWYNDDGQVLPRPKNEKIPVAKIVDARLDQKGVWVKAEINQNLYSFNQVWGSIRDGFLKAFSVAFYPVQRAGNIIKSLNLVNVTLTGSPVNPNATFTATMKSALAYMKTLEEDNKMAEEKPEEKCSAEVKAEDKFECKECHKDFDSKEALDKHYEEEHKSEPDKKAEDEKKEDKKHEDAETKEEEKKEHAEMKSLREEVTALKQEVVDLKAKLEKPVMKSVFTEPEKKIEEKKIISFTPLQLI